jgi:hypothetical protein
MAITSHIPQAILDQMRLDIANFRKIAALYNQKADEMEATIKKMEEAPNPKVHVIAYRPKISKSFARMFLQQIKKPVRTAEVIELTYRDADEQIKAKAIKTLSVVFNTLAKDGEITVKKQKGVKGNYYQWIQK